MNHNRKYLNRFLAFVLAAALIVTYMPMSRIAFAEAEATSETQTEASAEEKKAEPAPAPETPKEEKSEPVAAPEPTPEPATEETSEPAEPAADVAEPADVAEEVPADVVEGENPEALVEEEAPEEEAYPAQNFSGEAGGVSVSVSAPKGALPEGTTMSVTYVSPDEVMDAVESAVDGEVKTVKAVDITFKKDGTKIEPNKAVSVHMNASGMDSNANQSVVHIADNGAASVVTENVNDGEATFKSDAFSVYIVVDTDDSESQDHNAVATYKFYVGEELKNTQNIKSGDTLLDPGALGAENGSNSVFRGWYVAEDQDQTISGETPGSKLTFGTKSSVPKTETIKVVAKIDTTYYVTFLGEKIDGERNIVAVEAVTVNGPKGTEGTLDISSKTVIPKADTSAFEGWSESDGGSLITTDTITITDDKTLYASVVDAHWIHFDENVDWETSDSDPTYTGPVYVKNTDDVSTKKPADPTRKGYEFGEWYKDKECTEAFEWTGTGLDDDITLYAKWTPVKTTYTVVIWKQKVDDAVDAAEKGTATYDYESSVELEALTGTELSTLDFSSYKGLTYTGFHYSDRIVFSDDTVKANGSTVVNVYYDRNILTINFVSGTHNEYVEATDNSGTQYGLVDDEYVRLTRNGRNAPYTWTYNKTGTYSGEYYHRVTNNNGTQYGLVDGQLVQLTRRNGNWYKPDGTRYYGDRYASGQGDIWNTTYGIVDGELTALDYDWWNEEYTYSKTITYTDTRYKMATVPTTTQFVGLYGSSLADNGYTWPSEQTWYENPNSGGTRLTFLDAFKFDGLSGVSPDGTVLTQYSGNSAGTNTIRFYKQNLDGETYPETATNTVYTSSNSTFTITEKYEGFTAVSYRNGTGSWHSLPDDRKVSASNLQLRFERNKYSLTFMVDGEVKDTKNGILYEEALAGHKIADPEKKHYRFVCWCNDPEGNSPVDWENSKMPAANKVVYAKFEQVQYHISLDPNGGEIVGTLDSEFNVDPLTILSKESMFKNTVWTKDTKHELVGWFFKNEDDTAGSVYDYAAVEGPVNLIAKWRMPGQVSIIYDAGEGGTLDKQPDNYKYATDSAVVLAAPPKVKEGYIFVGWKLEDENGNVIDTVYYPGNTFDISEDIIQNYNESTKTGEVHVVAVYNKAGEGPFEKTYIRWFKNDGSDCFHTDTLEVQTGDVEDSTLLVNEPVPIQAAPEREGYEFLGWAKVDESDDLALEQDLDEDDILIYYKDGTFYAEEACTKEATEVAADNDRKYEAMFAVWCKLDELNYDANGGTGDPMDPTSGKTGQDVEVSANEYEKEGYTFVEWNTAANGSGTSYDPGDDYTLTTGEDILYAQWEANKHTVTYVYDGDVPSGVNPPAAKTNVEYGSTVEAAPTPEAVAGYTFEGWDEPESFEMPDKDVTITGTWSLNKHTVTYVYDGDVPSGVNPPAEKTDVKYGSTVEAAPTPEAVTGYTFEGWDNAESFEMPDEDITITGTWSANKHKVTYVFEGDVPSGVNPPAEKTNVKYGSTVEAAPTPEAVTGYTFEGWDNAESFSMPDEDITITGTWSANKHKVTYVFEGDVPSGVNPPAEKTDVKYGSTVEAAPTPEAVTGYTFEGWDNAESFSMPDEDITITGTWSKDEPVEYTVTYRYTGTVPAGAPAVPAAATYAEGDTVNVAAAPSMTGYTFSGWSRTGSFTMPGENVTITGSWTANEPTPTPTPDGGDDNPGGGNNPGGDDGNPAVAPAPAAAAIPDAPVPQAEPATDIPDEPTPLAEGVWALVNLIAAIMTAVGAIVALFRKKEDEDEDNMDKDEDDNRSKKMLAAKIAGALAGVAAPITFFLTEDMSLPMALVDKWTILMIAILAVQVVAAALNKKASKLDDDEEEGAEGAAN